MLQILRNNHTLFYKLICNFNTHEKIPVLQMYISRSFRAVLALPYNSYLNVFKKTDKTVLASVTYNIFFLNIITLIHSVANFWLLYNLHDDY